MLTTLVPRLVVLSAPSGEQLQQYARRLRAWIAEHTGPDDASERLERAAYTLQVGRDELRERLALVVSSLSELDAGLDAFLSGATAGVRVHRGRTAREAEAPDGSAGETVGMALDADGLDALARRWVGGQRVDWERLYPRAERPPRLSLPTLPFLKKRYWIDEPAEVVAPAAGPVAPHPLVGRETADGGRTGYAVTLTGAEYFLRDHALGERKVLPAVAALEMAVAAGARTLGRPVARVENVLWSRPVIVTEQPVEVRLLLTPAEGGLSFEIECCAAEGGVQRCSAGTLFGTPQRETHDERLDVEKIRALCPHTASHADVYTYFEREGVAYGPGLRAIRDVCFDADQAVARVELPRGLDPAFETFVLHPSLLDAALQTASWAGGPPQAGGSRDLPFALARLEILRPLARTGYVRATRTQAPGTGSALTRYDLELTHDDGLVALRLEGFARRAVGARHALRPADAVSSGAEAPPDAYEQVWVAASAERAPSTSRAPGTLAVLDAEGGLARALRRRIGPDVVRITLGGRFTLSTGEDWQADLDDADDCRRWLAALAARAPGAPLRLVCRGLERAGEDATRRSASGWSRPALRLLRLFQAWAGERTRPPLRLLVLDDDHGDDGRASLIVPLAALAKSMANEDPACLCRVVELAAGKRPDAHADEALAALVDAELRGDEAHEFHVRYEGATRQVRRWRPSPLHARGSDTSLLREEGIYLVTGGLGKLGQAVVRELGAPDRGRFVLAGRFASPLHERRLTELLDLGVRVEYEAADLGRPDEARRLIERVRARHGALHGIVHLAGLREDGFLARKAEAEFERVMAPKVLGTLELDEASAGDALDFFVLFSSISGTAGTPGQGDYAYANAFLDTFAAWRERQRARGARVGRTLSILWPAWAQGGMRTDDATAARGVALSGIRPLGTAAGLAALRAALGRAGDHVLIADGERERVRAFLESTTHVNSAPSAATAGGGERAGAQDGPEALAREAQSYLKEILAHAFRLAPEEVDADTAFEVYGIDSILIMDLTRTMEQDFGPLPKTIFFEYQNLEALSGYFVEQHAAKLAARLAARRDVAPAASEAPRASAAPAPDVAVVAAAEAPGLARAGSHGDTAEPIAIIGVAARFAEADDLDAFWENLKNGRDCIVEIPRERWDWRAYEDATEVDAATRYSRWGSFVSDADCFDALFFGIAPREAEIVDPQERLFLEAAWHALEDAGYTRAALRAARAGVYVGVMYGLYQLYESERGRLAASSYASIANRVSYTLGLRGPSLALDTMCSSALTAIHLACQALHAGEIDVALAGGVNLHVHPYKYRLLGQGQFTSSDGRCRSFGEGGDGYVPGEGVGAVLLKPLGRALRDGDHVYGSILGSALNHGGKTNGYTVPNPVAQGDVIRDAFAAAGIAPDSVSYVEAHGTGTALGDPVEIRGLMRAFEGAGRRVPIGSVKSNIGHLESAAGMAALVKVLLQMKHRRLVPSLHSQTLSANIDWNASPFYVQQVDEPWQRPVARNGASVPLRAGISSFGAGGANAHVLVEEHVRPVAVSGAPALPRLVVLSAKTPERLRAHVTRFAAFLQREPGLDLTALAFTLQVGREGLEERLAVVVDSVAALTTRLSSFLEGGERPAGVHHASLRELAAGGRRAAPAAEVQAALDARDLPRLAELWVRGATPDWRALYDAPAPRRLPLPLYPFERTRCWIDAEPTGGRRPGALHPLLDQVDARHSLDGALAFRKRFRADEPLVRDHRVGGVSVLPGVVLLEMARAALREAGFDHAVLGRVRWLQPLVVNAGSVEARLVLRRTQAQVAFELLGSDAEAPVRHAEGVAELSDSAVAADERLAVDEIRARCNERLGGPELYREYEQAGLAYGPFFRALRSLAWNDDEALGEIVLPDAAAPGAAAYELHPALLDGALHALAAWRGPAPRRARLPYALERVERRHPLAARGFVHVRRARADRYDLALLDADGRVWVRLHDLALRAVADPSERSRGLLYAQQWVPLAGVSEHAADSLCTPREVWIVHGRGAERFAATVAEESGGGTPLVVKAGDLAAVRDLHDAPLPEVVHFISDTQGARERHDDPRALEAAQQEGVLALFRLVKLLLARGAASRTLRLVVTTHDVCEVAGEQAAHPFAGALHGFALSLAREQPRWDVRVIDASERDWRTDAGRRVVARHVASHATPLPERLLALRAGVRYRRRLMPLEAAAPGTSGLRDGGVYLLIGGAGGIGLELTRWLVSRFGARVVLVGRRSLDAEREARVRALDPDGRHIVYHRADAGEVEAMRAIVADTQARFGALHGVFHAAIVLRDQAIERMDEDGLREALDAKARVCVALGAALHDQHPDFVMFFSSAVALSGSAGQSNYAAGCTLKDGYARVLETHLKAPVHVLHWGYWGTVGIVAGEAYRRRLAEQGIGSIAPEEGLEALDAVLRHPGREVMVIKARTDVLAAAGVDFGTRLRWQPRDQPSVFAVLDEVEASFAPRTGVLLSKSDQERLERIGHDWLWNSFREQRVFATVGERWTLAALGARLGVAPKHARLLGELVRALASTGRLERAVDGSVAVASNVAPPADPPADLAGLCARVEALRGFEALLRRCMGNLFGVLRGEVQATDVLFPRASMTLVEANYQGNPLVDLYNDLTAAAVSTCVRERRRNTVSAVPLRVLEVGAGTGGTTLPVLRALAEIRPQVEYVYTDISKAFLFHGRQQYGGAYPFVTFERLDISRDVEQQGFAPGSFDVVLASNVLHATADIHASLHHAKALLKANGWLVLNEVTHNIVTTTLTFGLLDGWWLYEDEALRLPGSPLLSTDAWRRAVSATGFARFRALPETAGTRPTQHVMVAESDGLVRLDVVRRSAAASEQIAERAGREALRARIDPERASTPVAPSVAETTGLREAIERRVKQAFELVLQVPQDRLWPDETFESYGVDSLSVPQIVDVLAQGLGSLPATLLFEYPTIRKLGDYFVEHHAAPLTELLLGGAVAAPAGPARAVEAPMPSLAPVAAAPAPSALAPISPLAVTPARVVEIGDVPAAPGGPIAIIGLAGRYPMARDLEEFWSNLESGRDCVREVPPERWDWRAYREVDGAPVSRWGGFLEDVDQFDPLFFGMSRREAEFTDPQERLFLETVWQTLEDAACTRARLRAARVGVYVGVMYGHYQLLETADRLAGGMGYASIANRVSYFFDFQGPSLAVDSMCSASLSAIHLACQALWLDEIDYAVAGGVNLTVHPRKYVQLAAGRFTSPDGRCRAFGADGDGMVPGEGVGAVLLKPLAAAQRDGDRIHGVILGSALNHGGKTGGYSVPNPVAQSVVIEQALRRAGVSAESLGYIEAHGTGTALGDPIEMSGLVRAFQGTRPSRGKIPIGSLKSSIGHLESAAGIAAVTKVLLQMKHRRLAPSLHAERLNPAIDWERVPFAVQTALDAWPTPAGPGARRRAGVSAFGAGGSNAHLILEAYEEVGAPPAGRDDAVPRLFVLSARNEAQLREYAGRLARFLEDAHEDAPADGARAASDEAGARLSELAGEFLGVPGSAVGLDEPLSALGLDDATALRLLARLAEEHARHVPPSAVGDGLTLRGLLAPEADAAPTSAPDLDRIAYTLQVGREAMEERLALVASSVADLRDELRRFAAGAQPQASVGCHANARARGVLDLVLDGEDGRAYVRAVLARRGLLKLAQIWARGVELDWSALHEPGHPRPVSLPGYPFARTRCWLEVPREGTTPVQTLPVVPRVDEPLSGKRATGTLRVALYEPEWRFEPGSARPRGPVAVLAGGPQGRRWVDALRTPGVEPILIEAGESFERVGKHAYRLRFTQVDDHARVLAELTARGRRPRSVLWLPHTEGALDASGTAGLDATFFTALALLQGWQRTRADAPLDLMCLDAGGGDAEAPYLSALEGLFLSVAQETPRLRARVVRVPAGVDQDPSGEWRERLAAELAPDGAVGAVCLRTSTRRVPGWHRLTATPLAPGTSPLRSRGVYLVTGGAGGLGLVFARAIAESVEAPRLLLTGRSPLDAERQAALEALRHAGAEVAYVRSDVARESDVRGVLDEIRLRHGRLDGVLHAAGVTRDALLRNKTRAEAEAVLAPKLAGTLLLDRLTCADALDFFAVFSSTSAVFGSLGQCDYSYANAFLDRFAAQRDALRHRGLRSGRSLSINWPLWREGGMSADESRRRKLAAVGLELLEHAEGVAAFEACLALEPTQVLVLAGDAARVDALVRAGAGGDRPDSRGAAWPEVEAEPPWLSERILALTAAATGYAREELDLERSFEAHGLDSVGLTKLADALGRSLGLDLAPTVFFEAPTVRALSARLWERHVDVLRRVATSGSAALPPAATPLPGAPPAAERAVRAMPARRTGAVERDPVAIIGLAGILPGARDLEQFWERLRSGEPLVQEIPSERWDWRAVEGDPREHPDRTRVRWGGFVPHVDRFDPLFFGISPREADWMDPQQRLLLQTVWKAVEDAGLHPSALAGSDTGLFVGVGPSEYADLVQRSGRRAEAHAVTGLTASMLVNRVSYQLDLRGPSEPVDTACSSSLVALHRAVQALEHGHCRVAIAGGVNVLLSTLGYSALERAGMLSPDGVGRAFDRDANGYVRGEGVGVVVLKKLGQALADGDPIHALVCGSAVNHGGRASSLTAPNPEAQAQVIVRAWEQAGFDPRTATCIETHGTGTVLGDPVELNGLRRAFAELYRRWNAPAPAQPHCALLALKNVIGHLEPAAGIAAVLRVVLGLRHGWLTGTPHVRVLNPYLELSGTPFYVAREAGPWPVRAGSEAGDSPARRAGVSSFGYGGVNAHAVFEEYRGPQAAAVDGPVVFVLSARRPERLRAYAREFLRPEWEALWARDLASCAWTLQSGRAAFEERLAVVVREAGELRAALRRFADGDTAAVHTGRVDARHATSRPTVPPDASLDALARLWVQGAEVDWARLQARPPRRCSLPSYPFAEERYWFSREAELAPAASATSASGPSSPESTPVPTVSARAAETLYFRALWEPAPVASSARVVPALVFAAQAADLPTLDPDDVLVTPGRSFQSHSERCFEIDPRAPGDYVRLVAALRERGFALASVAHLWGLQAVDAFPSLPDESLTDRFLARGAGSLFLFLKALADPTALGVRRLLVATREDEVPGGLAFAEALGALAGSLRALMPDVDASIVRLADAEHASWPARCLAELSAVPAAGEAVVRYAEGRRRVQRLRPFLPAPEEARGAAGTRDGGVYLVTGGTGALGLLLAAQLARRHRARLALLARSPLADATARRLSELRALGADVMHCRGAVEDAAGVREVVAQIEARWGRLDGIFHLAGAPGKRTLRDQDAAGFRAALRARIDGALALDEATRDLPLELFVLYSSTAGHLGDFGVLDYGFGQRFLDGFAVEREERRRRGERRGRTLSIDWPLWRAGGMHVEAGAEERYLARTGFTYLESDEGERALHVALDSGSAQVMVAVGDRARILARVGGSVLPPASRDARVEGAPHALPAELKRILSDIVGVAAGEISADVSFGDYGLDSFGLKTFSTRLREVFGVDLPTTALFAANTVDDLARRLRDEFPGELQRALGRVDAVAAAARPSTPEARASRASTGTPDDRAVAVVGMSGRFPGSSTLDAFWEHLEQEHDLIGEVPPDRWDWRALAERYPGTPRWGGFLSDVDRFDALFFRISPHEARVMDPQHRLFLEEAWRALEDAGIRADRLAGHKAGVFVGVQFSDYESLVVGTGETNAYAGSGLARTMLANRLSYLLDLRGPSEAIDTACSSSLVAIHRAVRSLREGESELAIAGGVSLVLSPQTVVSAHGLGVLSPQGRCKTMDRSADGYVKGEGVAALVLKTLARALADGDPIHAVILGSAVSHGGRAHSLTAPNPDSQADLLVSAYRDAGIPFESVSYLELHGTGTELGDPVEIEAIQQAYRRLAGAGPRAALCGLGAVKSNIGHLEPAAGVAGVVKTILALRHAKLPASLHVRELNPLIRLDGTPFEPVRATRDWRPADAEGRALTRRAGVSSFGFGGVNAHVVLEEHAAAEPAVPAAAGAQIFVLSARDGDRLRRYAADVAAWLRRHEAVDLVALAHTFRSGRVPLATRLATVVRTPAELRERLEAHARGEREVPGLHHGDAEGRAWLDGADGRDYVELTLARGNLDRIARVWAAGADVDWERLPGSASSRRVWAPTYPFARERAWIHAGQAPNAEPPRATRELRLLAKVWRPESPGRGGNGAVPSMPAGLVLVLTNAETEALGQRLFTEDPRVVARVISGAQATPQDLPARVEDVVGLVDLSDVTRESRDQCTPNWGRIALVQALIRALRGRSPFVLHFTRELRAFRAARPTLAGASFAGLVRMLSAEYRGLHATTVDVDGGALDATNLRRIVGYELAATSPATESCWREGVRHLPAFAEAAPAAAGGPPWYAGLDEALVVISGGTRGIGLAIAHELVAKGARRLALMGRQPLPPVAEWRDRLAAPGTPPALVERLRPLVELQRPGVQIRCYTGPLEARDVLDRWLDGVKAELGPVAGVVHCAGASSTARPAFIGKSREEMEAALGPKVGGLVSLAAACAREPLRFFVLFSSVSAQVPALAAGISDYALANAFMDHFAEFQAAHGRTWFRSLQWPSWRGVGMEEVKSKAYLDLGLRTLERETGLDLLHRAMAVPERACLMPCVVEPGIFDPERLLRWPGASAPASTAVAETAHAAATEVAGTRVVGWLTALFAEELQMDAGRLPAGVGFAEFGVDSIMIAQLIRRIEAELDVKLEPSAFLESSSLARLARSLEQDHAEALHARLGSAPASAAAATSALPSPRDLQGEREAAGSITAPHAGEALERASPALAPPLVVSQARFDARHVAVVGLACHFPGAPDHVTFWRNLSAGHSAIGDVPPSRWDVARFYAPHYEKGKSISRWGGFLPAIEEFDPDFFRIDRALAAQVDPLIRQVLEVSAECVQDAGLESRELAGRRVAVMVGGRSSNFGYYNQGALRSDSISGLAQNFIAAHVAQFLDLRGANLVVDSACSSSLVSVHLACQSLRLHECDLALAGGVEILLDEVPFVGMSEGRALSPTGKCHTFDASADGIVLGEGAGMLLLKRCEDALRDGDRIWAVIEAGAVNNDGRTMGITTPNPDAQKSVIEEALAAGGLRASQIGYVEAHGTGTMIGDPIELKALTEVFRRHTDARGYCGVGSVKTNIGHLLSAAGIAGLIKVILSIRHGLLAPTLNCATLNPRFKFGESPFYPVRSLQDWPETHGRRRAGISSFGFGGTNAHLIVSAGDPAAMATHVVRRPVLPPVEYQRRRCWPTPSGRPAGNGAAAAHAPAPPVRPFLELRFEREPSGVR